VHLAQRCAAGSASESTWHKATRYDIQNRDKLHAADMSVTPAIFSLACVNQESKMGIFSRTYTNLSHMQLEAQFAIPNYKKYEDT